MDDCLFCKIIKKQIPANIVYEDDLMIAFHDINPVAPVHILFIPKKHIVSMAEITPEDSHISAGILQQISAYAHQHGYDKTGFRIITNTGENAGQTVFHIHFHLLAGRIFQWPPG